MSRRRKNFTHERSSTIQSLLQEGCVTLGHENGTKSCSNRMEYCYWVYVYYVPRHVQYSNLCFPYIVCVWDLACWSSNSLPTEYYYYVCMILYKIHCIHRGKTKVRATRTTEQLLSHASLDLSRVMPMAWHYGHPPLFGALTLSPQICLPISHTLLYPVILVRVKLLSGWALLEFA